jgi:hypothetical protein
LIRQKADASIRLDCRDSGYLFAAKILLIKLNPEACKPYKRTTTEAKLNRGGSDSFFAIRIFVIYDFLNAKN